MLVAPQAVLDIIKRVAAAEIMPRFRHLTPDQIRTKSGPTDFVTEADEASERALNAALMALLPGSTVVGEEAVAADAAILDRIKGEAPVWIIDPIDGTSFFAHGETEFCVMVALAVKGETQQGWIYEPVSGRTLIVAKGQGVTIDGAKMGPRKPVAHFKDMQAMISGKFRRDSELADALRDAAGLFASVLTPGCAGCDYANFLSGKPGDFILYRLIKPWDHAVGQLALKECGAYAARLDGSPYDIANAEGEGLLIATDKQSWLKIHEALLGRVLPLSA